MHPKPGRPRAFRRTALAGLMLCGAAAAQAQEPPMPTEPDDRLRYVLGLKLHSEPTYAGSDTRALQVAPLWAVRLGRWRISTGGVSGLVGTAANAGSGASTDLYRGERFASSLGLRLDGGRSSSDDPMLSGLSDVKRTVRLRLGSRYRLPMPGLQLDGSLSVDALGRGGGATAAFGIGYSARLTPRTTWGAGFGWSLGDGTYLMSRYGVPDAAVRPGRPAYRPASGLHQASAGLVGQTELTPHWVLLTELSASQLLRSAARSPLTKETDAVSASISLVWRPTP